jgi:hypothetical protein
MGKWAVLYRKIGRSRGFGVHSPFVFDLITKVIGERSAYYFYSQIDASHGQLSQNRMPVTCRNTRTRVGKAFRKYGISLKEGKLLFRLANRYQPVSVLTVGSSMGLTPLCLSGYASAVRCIALEENSDFAGIAMTLVREMNLPSIKIRLGEYEKEIVPALETLGGIDCLYLGKTVDSRTQESVFAQCLPYFHEKSICLVAGIHASPARKQCWTRLCRLPKVTVSVDLYMLGILFLHPRLNRRTYKSRVD